MTNRGNWRDFVSLEDTSVSGLKRVVWNNGKGIGEVIQDVDGYWKFGTNGIGGLWEAYALEILAEMMNDMNSAWDKEIQEYFEDE